HPPPYLPPPALHAALPIGTRLGFAAQRRRVEREVVAVNRHRPRVGREREQVEQDGIEDQDPRHPDRARVLRGRGAGRWNREDGRDRKSTRLNSSHEWISYA